MTTPKTEFNDTGAAIVRYSYALIELTLGPWQGQILRCESMTHDEALARNTSMSGTVIEWQRTFKRVEEVRS